MCGIILGIGHENICRIQWDDCPRHKIPNKIPRFPHVLPPFILPNLNVGLVATFMASDAFAAIANCASEYGGYCLSCNSPYVVATNSYLSVGNSMGQGTQCVLYCGEERNGNVPLDRFCNLTTSAGDNNSSTRYTYTVKSTYSGRTCYTGDTLSAGTTTTTSFCSNSSYIRCNSGWYGTTSYGASASTYCTKCQASSFSGLYSNSGLSQERAGQSTAGTKIETGCYLPTGTYYDKTGTLELVSSCYYSN